MFFKRTGRAISRAAAQCTTWQELLVLVAMVVLMLAGFDLLLWLLFKFAY